MVLLDLSSWHKELGTLGNCGKYTKSYLPHFTGSMIQVCDYCVGQYFSAYICGK